MKRLSTLAASFVLACSTAALAGLTSTEIAVADATMSSEYATVEAVSESLAIEPDFGLVTLEDESPQVVEVEEAMPIPEPAAAAILLGGLGSMAWMRYRLG